MLSGTDFENTEKWEMILDNEKAIFRNYYKKSDKL